MDMEKLLKKGADIEPSTISEWCKADNTRLKTLVSDILNDESLRGVKSRYLFFSKEPSSIMSGMAIDPTMIYGPMTGAEKIEFQIKEGADIITSDEFAEWYYRRWKPEEKSVSYMSELLTIAIECNKDLYANGVPEGATTHSENKRIKKWLDNHPVELEPKVKDHIRLVVKPV